MGSFRAELLILRKYPAYWVLFAITIVVNMIARAIANRSISVTQRAGQ